MEFDQHSFSYFSPKIYNKIPAIIKSSAAVATFKRWLNLSHLATHTIRFYLATARTSDCLLVMAALRSRCGHYIFALFLSFFFFPRLISAAMSCNCWK